MTDSIDQPSSVEKLVAVLDLFSEEGLEFVDYEFSSGLYKAIDTDDEPWCAMCSPRDYSPDSLGKAVQFVVRGYEQVTKFAGEHVESIDKLYNAMMKFRSDLAEANASAGAAPAADTDTDKTNHTEGQSAPAADESSAMAVND